MYSISASLIKDEKDCSFINYMKRVLRIRRIEQSDVLRIGTNWHGVLDVMALRIDQVCPECHDQKHTNDACPLCAGTDAVINEPIQRIAQYLDDRYETLHPNMDMDKASLEKTRLLNAAAGYMFKYQDREEEVLCYEQDFRLPIIYSRVKNTRGFPEDLLGKIDKIVRRNSKAGLKEHKSTSSSVEIGSEYWDALPMDTQAKIYVYAAQRMQLEGEFKHLGILPTDPLIDTVYYDVFKKPTTGPKDLTQKLSKEFVESGEFYGVEFEIAVTNINVADTEDVCGYMIYVDGVLAEVKMGAKVGTYAIKETHAMYGARLLADMVARPEFYFAEKELTFNEAEIAGVEKEIEDVAINLFNQTKYNTFVKNERHCTRTYTCEYYGLCRTGFDLEGQLPVEFERKEEDASKETTQSRPAPKPKYTGQSGPVA